MNNYSETYFLILQCAQLESKLKFFLKKTASQLPADELQPQPKPQNQLSDDSKSINETSKAVLQLQQAKFSLQEKIKSLHDQIFLNNHYIKQHLKTVRSPQMSIMSIQQFQRQIQSQSRILHEHQQCYRHLQQSIPHLQEEMTRLQIKEQQLLNNIYITQDHHKNYHLLQEKEAQYQTLTAKKMEALRKIQQCRNHYRKQYIKLEKQLHTVVKGNEVIDQLQQTLNEQRYILDMIQRNEMNPNDECMKRTMKITDKTIMRPSNVDSKFQSLETPQEPSFYLSEQKTKDRQKQTQKEPLAQVSKQPLAQISKQPSVQVSKQPSAPVSKQPSAQVSKQASAQVSKQPSMQASKKDSVQVSKESSRQAERRQFKQQAFQNQHIGEQPKQESFHQSRKDSHKESLQPHVSEPLMKNSMPPSNIQKAPQNFVAHTSQQTYQYVNAYQQTSKLAQEPILQFSPVYKADQNRLFQKRIPKSYYAAQQKYERLTDECQELIKILDHRKQRTPSYRLRRLQTKFPNRFQKHMVQPQQQLPYRSNSQSVGGLFPRGSLNSKQLSDLSQNQVPSPIPLEEEDELQKQQTVALLKLKNNCRLNRLQGNKRVRTRKMHQNRNSFGGHTVKPYMNRKIKSISDLYGDQQVFFGGKKEQQDNKRIRTNKESYVESKKQKIKQEIIYNQQSQRKKTKKTKNQGNNRGPVTYASNQKKPSKLKLMLESRH